MHDIHNTLTEFDPKLDESEFGGDAEFAGTLDEAEEMELAAALLEVADEAELDQFLGGLLRKAGRAVGRAIRSSTGRALGGMLKGAAKQTLPHLKRTVGAYLDSSADADADVDANTGADIADQAGRIFDLELEGLSPEDKEFELARRFVRFANHAVQHAEMQPTSAPPQAAARNATVAAARQHAPGLIAGPGAQRAAAPARTQGRWQRHGRTIVINGI